MGVSGLDSRMRSLTVSGTPKISNLSARGSAGPDPDDRAHLRRLGVLPWGVVFRFSVGMFLMSHSP